MSETTFTLLIHHGGRFNGNTRRRYIGGRVTQVCDDLDIDKVSYPEIMSYVKEDLRYELDSIAGLYYYKIPQGNFVCVQDDRTILNIVSKLRSRAQLEFFVDHKILEKQVTLDLQREVIKVDDIQQGVENVVDEADWESQIDVNLQNNQGSRIMVNGGSDNIIQDGDLFEGKELDYEDDMGDGIIQQNFDNLNVDINFLTDDDEEELQQSRENIRASKKKNASSMKHNMTNAEGDSRCDDVDAYGDQIMLNLQDDEVYMAGLESDNDSTGSFYYDSDDNCSYYSDTDEECGDHALRRPSKIMCFDPMAVIAVFCCGMIFQNVQECRDALAKYAIMKGLQIHFIKNDQVRVRAGCMEKCPWKFLASKNGHNNNFTVKTYVPNHKYHRKNTNPMATSKYLAKLLRERLMATPFIKYKDLMSLCRIELKLKISMTQARNIREKVIADLMGSYTEEYKRLHDYVQEINASNPPTTCVVKASRDEGEDINYFRSFYVCFAACKQGWAEGCRKIIGLDGCFLKGVCKGQLLCVVGRDENNQMFPIAWAVVSIENKENWSWFLNLLKYDLSIGDGAELTIISDMQKGLDSAINEHFPEVEHRMCARHVYAAWSKKWKGEERKIAFWNCARSTFENDMKSKLRALSLLGNGIIDDFLRYNVESFSKVYFRTTSKCDAIDNNMAETFNGWILDARCKPIISMLEEIRIQVMRRLYIQRRFCRSWICGVGPRPMQKLEKNKELSFQWQMVWNGDEEYEVSNVYDRDNRHVVNLKSSTCTCREWDLTGIPCQHVICALYGAGREPEDFIVHWYTEATYLKAYQFMMRPVRGKILWVNSGKEEIAPPPHKKLPGRPKVNRQKDKHEIKKIGKLSRKGRIMTCKICKQDGHNIRKCPQRMSTVTQGNSSMKRKNAEINEAIRKNHSAELVNEFMKEKEQVKRGSTSQLQNKASSQVQQAPGQSSSQMQQPISEIREERSSKRRIQPNQQGKRSKTTAKVRPTKVPTGYGCYVNENTGQTILNPGTWSMKSLYIEQRIMEEHSQYGKKDVPGRENPTSSGLKWKGKAAMTTAQLQVKAQRKIISVTAQAKGRK